jgi:hypothetical protein
MGIKPRNGLTIEVVNNLNQPTMFVYYASSVG